MKNIFVLLCLSFFLSACGDIKTTSTNPSQNDGSNTDGGDNNGNPDNSTLPDPVADTELLSWITKYAETWNRNWNYEGAVVDGRFNGNYGFWEYNDTTYEPWLFDRASVGYYLYVHTRDTRWLNQFVTDLEWYAARIDQDGIFRPKGYDDTKYSYITPFLHFKRLFPTDARNAQFRTIADRIYQAWQTDFPNTYSTGGLWTEREIGLALDAAISYHELAFEGQQNSIALDRARALITQWTYVSSQNGNTGAPLVTIEQHEGGGQFPTQLVTSPWMSALYFQAARRYYEITQDTEVLTQASRYFDFLDQYAFVDGSSVHPNLAGTILPYYLLGPTGPYTPETPSHGDMGHAIDVAGLIKFAIEAKQILGQSVQRAELRYAQMRTTAIASFNYDYRPATSYLPKYRLAPPRKFNWQMRGYNEIARD